MTFPQFLEKNLVTFDKYILRKFHPLRYLFWECTLNCNFKCAHCGSNAGERMYKDELSGDEIKKVFKDISRLYDPRKIMLAITGGEPLLRRDLFDVMNYASGLGYSWGVVTNGFFVTQDIVNKMKNSGMKTAVVSIDGIGRIHNDIRGNDKAYEHAISAIKLLVKDKYFDDIQITTTVNSRNIYQLEKMYEVFISLGVDSWRVMNVDPIGRAENSDLLLNKTQFRNMLEFIKRKRVVSSIDLTYGCSEFLGSEFEMKVRKNFFTCHTGLTVGSILHNGDIFVCPNVPRRAEFIQGNVRNDEFVEVWEHKYKLFRKAERTCNEKCKNCIHWELCLGGSFHNWDFSKNQTKLCAIDMLHR